MKEEIENAREETILKSEQLSILENRYDQSQKEVSLPSFAQKFLS